MKDLLKKKINNIKLEIENFNTSSKDNIEQYKKKFISRNSIFSELFEELKNFDVIERKKIGELINSIKKIGLAKYELINSVQQPEGNKKIDLHYDFTLKVPNINETLHPLTIIEHKIKTILSQLGFTFTKGPEIEDEFHNFTALNIKENHPARDIQDTFFIGNNNYLRSQTSSVQIRALEKYNAPIRAFSHGKTYRKEDISARSHCFFNQIEGFCVDKNISFIDLKNTIDFFLKNLFNKLDIKTKIRASYFPFTEPSVEFDIECLMCKSKGCNICKYTGWLELGGAGMIDPNVLENCNINSKIFSGFAFGFGIERITMIYYGINDIRLFTENKLLFLKQFHF